MTLVSKIQYLYPTVSVGIDHDKVGDSYIVRESGDFVTRATHDSRQVSR